MSSLQWALLLLGAGIALALIVSSIREKRARARPEARPAPRMTGRDWEAAVPAAITPSATLAPAATPTTAPTVSPASPSPSSIRPITSGNEPFDEFGVGRARRRTAPEIGIAEPAAPMPGRAGAPAVPPQLFGLYIAEHEGTNILGPKIHAALKDRGLRFGHKKIYHCYEGDTVQFSVASLVKPGSLDPADAEGFATPGLSVFMVLPGPVKPLEALQAMLETARGLAKSLNAELYDSEQRAPFTAERERALRQQVEEWARRSAASARGGT